MTGEFHGLVITYKSPNLCTPDPWKPDKHSRALHDGSYVPLALSWISIALCVQDCLVKTKMSMFLSLELRYMLTTQAELTRMTRRTSTGS